MNTRIWLSPPHMTGSEINFVQDAFHSNWVAPQGPHIDSFEKELANYTGKNHCAAVSSGTAALHLALVLLNVGANDLVLCQSLTFAASAFPITYLGATPVFIDSEPETWNLCPDTLEETILFFLKKGRKPKAVIGVHLYGMPGKLTQLLRICQTYEIPFIEDAAEALGSSYQGQKAGSFGDLSFFSFNGNKIITTSGGGALLSNDESLVQKARFLSTQARDPALYYQHSQIGFNYRLSNVCAGIGLGQLKVIDERVMARRANFDYYVRSLSDLPGVSFQQETGGSLSNRWLTCLLIDPKESDFIRPEWICQELEKAAIETRLLWKPMHLQPVFRDAPYFGSRIAQDLFKCGICLPSGSGLSKEDLNRVIEAIRFLFSTRRKKHL